MKLLDKLAALPEIKPKKPTTRKPRTFLDYGTDNFEMPSWSGEYLAAFDKLLMGDRTGDMQMRAVLERNGVVTNRDRVVDGDPDLPLRFAA